MPSPSDACLFASSFLEKSVESAVDHLVKQADAAGNPVPLSTFVPF